MSRSHFDHLLNCLHGLEKQGEVPNHVQHHIHILQVQLRFIRMIIRWSISWTRQTVYEDWVQAAQTEVMKVYFKISRLCKTRDYGKLHETVENLLMNIGMHQDSIKAHCELYMEKHQHIPFFGIDGGLVIDDLVKELLDPLLENMNNLISRFRTHPLQEQLQVLQEKLKFVRNFLALVTKDPELLTLRGSENLLIRIELLSENALFFCSICWWNEEIHLEILLADLLLKIKHIEPFIRLAYSQVLKASSLENKSAVGIDFQALGAVDHLLSDLEAWLKRETGSAIIPLEEDQIAILSKELRFLKDFLMDPPPKEHCTDIGRFYHLLKQIRALAEEVRSVVQSLSLRKTKDDMSDKLNVTIGDLLKCINIMKAEIRQNFLNTTKKSLWTFSRALNFGFRDFFLQNLEALVRNRADLIAPVKDETETLLGELLILRSFLGEALEQHKNVGGLKQIEERVMNVSYKAEFLIDSITVGNGPIWCYILSLSDVLDEIKLLKTEATQICDICMHMTEKASENDEAAPDNSPDEEEVVGFSDSFTTRSLGTHSSHEEEVVGFDDEAEKISKRLQRGPKHLDIVSIIGMPGLGKTTLAQKLYNSGIITSYFHVRSWCCVSQVYTRRGLLLDILDDIIELDDSNELAKKTQKLSDDDLAELLCKSLKGRRYLIVLDDIWSIDAWRDLSCSFPDQANGSRILLTSRGHDVSLLAKPESAPNYLRMFSKEESWLLLQKKVFRERSCPLELSIIGEQIAENCRGLPLSVVLVAGILKKIDETEHQWKEIEKSMSKHAFDEERKIVGVLELSYKHLQDHLKPCFLYFGIFPEDREITIQKLLWLWIAEGLAQKTEGKNLEDVAEGYLKDLIGRSLVIVAKSKSKGGVKACRIHDLLLQFCLEKAKEENFMLLSRGNEEIFTSWNGFKVGSHYSPEDEPQRLCIHANREDMFSWRPFNYTDARSLLFFATAPDSCYGKFPNDFSFLQHSTKLLRVLDLVHFNLGENFPVGVEFLVHLRYLAIRGKMDAVPSSIVKLWNLETLIVKGMRGEVVVPDTLWKMPRLRHLQIRDRAAFASPEGRDDNTFVSVDVESIATPSLRFGDDFTRDILTRLPCLRKLRCIFLEWWDFSRACNRFPVLDFLSKLESLKVFYYGKELYPCEFNFPLNLKKLTLSKFRLPWSEISKIGRLPSLEVLKLLFRSFEGDRWDMKDGEFLNLRFLKFDTLNIAQWNVSSDHFPCLQHLVLQRCKRLESIPSCMGIYLHCKRLRCTFAATLLQNRPSSFMSNNWKWEMMGSKCAFILQAPASGFEATSQR